MTREAKEIIYRKLSDLEKLKKRFWKFATGSEEGWQDGTKAIA